MPVAQVEDKAVNRPAPAARQLLHSAGLKATLHSSAALSESEREEMWLLFSRFYEGTSRARFRADLAGKDTALILRDEWHQLQGFSTLALSVTQFEGAPIRVLFSGDTIVERAHWGSQVLAFNWLRHAGALQRQQPEVPLYWFLIVKGQRTYRYLPTFAREFTPDWRSLPSPRAWRLLAALAQERFGEAYDPLTGVIRFREPHGHLAPEWAQISEREAARADVRFFMSRNPGYAQGDELACLCELAGANMRPLARRIFEDETGA
jgi:hypothetical protein